MGSLGWCRALLADLLHQYGLRFILYGYFEVPHRVMILIILDARGKDALRVISMKINMPPSTPIPISSSGRGRWWEFHLVVVRRTNNVWYTIKGTSTCDCHHLSPDISKIQTILRNGGIPLISMRTPRLFDSNASLISIELDVIE
jgi:hypothetical protein